MATLLDSVTQAITPQTTKQYSELLGVEQTQVTEGIQSAAPLVLGAVGAKVANTEGADEVLGSLKEDAGDPLDAVSNGKSDMILNQLFGMGAAKAARWLEDTTGVNVLPYLPLVAPYVINAIQNAVKTDNLDASGLAALVKTENAAFTKAHPQLASEINAALDAGQNVNERAARIRAQFTDDEWNALAKTPTLAGYAVMMSSLSGPVGINKEITALLEAMAELGEAAETDSLVGLVSREYNSPEQIAELGANRENATTMMRDACLETLRILNEKETYDETIAYKQFVVQVATRVAEAAVDGGLMSIGGKPVSDEEQMTLDLLAAALAYQP